MRLELSLSKMVHGGLALARAADGRVALVRGGLPGERVWADVGEKRGVLQGEVSEVLDASPDRVPAPAHPGLDYGFIRYERQLALKREVVQDAIARATRTDLGTVAVSPVVPAPEVWGYRSAVQPVAQQGALGYRRPESHEVVFLDDDPTALAGVRRLWRAWPDLAAPKGVREVVLRGNRQGEVLAALVATASERSLLDFAHTLVRAGVSGVTYAPFDPRGRFRSGSRKLTGARSILEDYGDFRIQVTAQSFAQPNPAAASRLYLKLRELAPGGRRALDLYAGSGVIGMHLLAKYEEVLALEVDKGSVLRGEQDAARLGLAKLRFLRGDAKRFDLPAADLIALDPPRAGLSRPLRDALHAATAGVLLYVSCDPVTWARDVADFLERGWRLTHAEPFDFYPQTHHVEMLSRLER